MLARRGGGDKSQGALFPLDRSLCFVSKKRGAVLAFNREERSENSGKSEDSRFQVHQFWWGNLRVEIAVFRGTLLFL